MKSIASSVDSKQLRIVARGKQCGNYAIAHLLQERSELMQFYQILLGLGRKLVKMIKKLIKFAILMTMKKYKFMEMVAECLAGKTEAEIKEQFDFLRIDKEKLDWSTFQEIAAGTRYPQNKTEFEFVRLIVDYENPRKYSTMEWIPAFFELAASEPSVNVLSLFY